MQWPGFLLSFALSSAAANLAFSRRELAIGKQAMANLVVEEQRHSPLFTGKNARNVEML